MSESSACHFLDPWEKQVRRNRGRRQQKEVIEREELKGEDRWREYIRRKDKRTEEIGREDRGREYIRRED